MPARLRHPRTSLGVLRLVLGGAALAWAVGSPAPGPVFAGTYSLDIQPGSATSDAHLMSEAPFDQAGADAALDLQVESSGLRRHLVVQIPISGLAGKTVVQAWLRLRQSSGSSPQPLDARVHALTESWNEALVSWSQRALLSSWATPGGTRTPAWTDRALVGGAQTGTDVGWQVGPILQDWQSGALEPNGLVVVPQPAAGSRSTKYRSSEYATAGERPRLLIYYTDEPPAIRTATAEIQPRALQLGSSNVPLSLYLDVDAIGATPSGLATGFDALTLQHRGALAITGLDRMLVGGVPIPTAAVTWSDAGTSVTLRFPRIRISGKVRLDLRASVLGGVSGNGQDMPMLLDDSTTPGAWAQAIWTGEADGTPGNGDDWVVKVTSSPTVSVDLVPDTGTVVVGTCTDFTLHGQDSAGNRYGLTPDSVRVEPPSAGTFSISGRFCASQTGSVTLRAWYGGHRDSALVTVDPALTPILGTPILRDRGGVPVTALAPGDTMFLDLDVSDADGFRDVREVRFGLFHEGYAGANNQPAFSATFRWKRGDISPWKLMDPVGSTWEVLPALCGVDSVTNSPAPQTVRLAFVVGSIARASRTGAWSCAARVFSATPPDTTSSSRPGLDAEPRLVLSVSEDAARFSPSTAGSLRQPVSEPSGGHLLVKLSSNADLELKGWARDLAGTVDLSDTLFVHRGTRPLRWAFHPGGTGGGQLDTAAVSLALLPAPVTESVTALPLHLWADYADSLSSQDYEGRLHLRADLPTFNVTTPPADIALTASVVDGGLAAAGAVSEVTPNTVVAGATQVFDAFVLPDLSASDTGINWVSVTLPPGYGPPAVTSVRVGGASVAFADSSTPDRVVAVMATRALDGQLVRVRFTAAAPTLADSAGGLFSISFDDTATSVPPQTASEGDANLVSDWDSWRVRVAPGAVSLLRLTPADVECAVDSVVAFRAEGWDAHGNPAPVAPAWSVTPAIGSIAPDGRFTAAARGMGIVIARQEGAADTASVIVHPRPAIVVQALTGPGSMRAGEEDAPFEVRVDNRADEDVRLDSLVMTFSRSVRDDARGEMWVARAPELPVLIPADGSVTLRVAVTASIHAAPGTLIHVDAAATGTTLSSAVGVADNGADAPLPVAIVAAGVDVSAAQSSAPVMPGDSLAMFVMQLANRYPGARTLQRLAFVNRSTGAGTTAQLDRALGTMTLHLDDGDSQLGPGDVPLAHAAATVGRVTFDALTLSIAGGSTLPLLVTVRPPLDSRDGDRLDLRIESAADIGLSPASLVQAAWPVDPLGASPVNGMAAAQIDLSPIPAGGVNPSATDVLVLDVVVPPNGHEPDVLQSLDVVNAGSAAGGSDLTRVRAWADNGDGAFDPASDRVLGAFSHTGARWQLSGLAESVPLSGRRLFITADLGSLAAQGATLQFALPAGHAPGLGMASANDGPLDRAVTNPSAQVITDSDRITLDAAPLAATTARPGDRDVVLLQLRALNTYTAGRTLQSLTVTNATLGSGTVEERDRELRQVVLRADGDGDGALDAPDVDPVLGTGFFSSGRVTFAGLSHALPAGASRQMFVTAEVSPTQAADGDQLSARIAGPDDVVLAEPSAIAGAWPLDSGARVGVDGFSTLQLIRFPSPSVTVSPGDGPLLALDAVVPANGYRADLLQGVRVRNVGTAQPSDIAAMQLWQDGGDGAFSAGGGDDLLLGTMTALSGLWQSPLLSTPVAGSGTRLFVSVTLAAGADDSVTVALQVPRDGVSFDSGNDGPNDADADPNGTLLVSTSPLLASMSMPSASTIGQSVPLRMVLRNAGPDTIRDIVPGALQISGRALRASSGPVPALVTIAPGASDTLTWVCVADSAGVSQASADAEGTNDATGLPRRALRASAAPHRVFLGSSSLDMVPVETMPVNVNRGQTEVVPFSLTLSNPGGAGASDVRVQSLRVRLEDETGQPIIPADLLQRVTISEGTSVYLVKTALETSGSDISLPLASPAQITESEPTTLAIRLDILANTLVPSFRVILTDSTAIAAQDVTSLAPVTVRPLDTSYPVRSNAARIVERATRIDVTALPGDTVRASRGSRALPLLTGRFDNPGVSGLTSDVRLSGAVVEWIDLDTGARLSPASLLERVRVTAGGQTVLARLVSAADSTSLSLAFSPPVNVPANAPVDLALEADLLASAPLGRYRARLTDTTRVIARDATTGALLPARFPQDSVAGVPLRIEAAAESVRVAPMARMPERMIAGQSNVPAFAATLRHPGPAGTAAVRLDSLTVSCRDQARAPLAPASLLDRVRIHWNGSPVAQSVDFPGTASPFTVPLPGLTLAPGDTANLLLEFDLEATAPVGWIELVSAATGLHVVDANSGLPVQAAAEPGSELPMVSGLGRIETPSRLLTVGLDSRMPVVVAADGRPVPAAVLTLANTDSAASGPILVDRLRVRASDRALASIALGAVASRVEAYLDGVLWARTADLTPDSVVATMAASEALAIDPAQPRQLELRFIPQAGVGTGSVRVGLDRPDIGVVQPASALLAVAVQPRPGSAFVLWSEAGGFAAADLRSSYANFPNPFAAGREQTRVVYHLRQPARVTLQILSARGEEVVTLLDGAPRPAGLHQDDRWDGRNGRGDTVYNGVYLARLTVVYADGSRESLLRKLAVVR